MMILWSLSFVGFAISLYAMRVKWKIKREKGYRPVCDIRSNISCTKALASGYSATSGIPNPVLGILYYAFMIGLSFVAPHLMVFPAAAAVVFSLYLAFISYVIQKNFCLVCTATYVVNGAILLAVFPH